MADLLKNMLALGITVGLSDRENFIKKVAGVIEDYQKDPGQAEKWATGIVAYLEDMKENIRIQNTIKSSMPEGGLANKEQIEKLTAAIEQLTTELKNRKV